MVLYRIINSKYIIQLNTDEFEEFLSLLALSKDTHSRLHKYNSNQDISMLGDNRELWNWVLQTRENFEELSNSLENIKSIESLGNFNSSQ